MNRKTADVLGRCRGFSSIGAVLIFTLVSVVPGFSQQQWQRAYGGTRGDQGNSVRQTSDGGYILTGFTSSFGAGNYDVYLVRANDFGYVMWTRTYGGTGSEWGYSVQQTSDGGFVIAGHTSSFGAGNEDVFLIKTSASGDTLWKRTYGGTEYDRGHSVHQTSDGGYIIAGETWSFGAGGYDVYLVKTDAGGDTLWTRTFGGPRSDLGYSVQQTSDSGYIVTGATMSFGSGGTDVYLIRTDASGDALWTRTYGGPGDDEGWSARQTSDGFIVFGSTASFGSGGSDVYLIKTDAAGDTLWTRTCGGTGDDKGYSGELTFDGGYVVAGATTSFGAGASDVYLIRTDASGETLWTRTYGGANSDWGYSVEQTSDTGYVVAGQTYSLGAGNSDAYLVKTDAQGNSAVEEGPGSPARFREELLLSAAPSPRGASMILRCRLPPGSRSARLEILDATGRLVRTFGTQRLLHEGTAEYTWDGDDDKSRKMPSGCYLCVLWTQGRIAQTKLLLVR